MINSFTDRYRFLSNFYPVEIEHKGIKYPSVEHYYVALKVKNSQIINGHSLSWVDCRELISKISTPGEVKRIGRTLTLRKDWDDVKLKVMDWGVRQKFERKDLLELLMITNDEELIEGNFWHDNFWGSCTCNKCGNKGENNLGKILMNIRNEHIS